MKITDLLLGAPYHPIDSNPLYTLPTQAPCRAVWARPISGEDGFPEQRIIHSRALQLAEPTRLKRIGITAVPLGYCKCASIKQMSDWVSAFRVLPWDGDQWRLVCEKNHLPAPPQSGCRWFALDGLESSSLII